MADIQYLNYGDLQIELLALMTKLADLVQGYVAKQPWSSKRKEKFMSAYTDIMNRGIIGASNSTGLWQIDVNGDPLPFDSMDRKDREMYQEAAYFIQLQMAGLPTKASLEDEAKKKVEVEKSELPIFEFNNSFKTHVNNKINGGQPLNIGYGESDLWNYLDERDSTGKRGREKRAEKLALLLESYKSEVSGDGSKFNFEGSPYSDINDFNSKIDTAIAALRTPNTDDDKGALLAIGLNSADWFNDGTGDPSGKKITLLDGTERELTYGELLEYNAKLEKLKLELNLLKQKADQQAAYNNTLFFNRVTNNKMQGLNPVTLKEKYRGDDKALIQALLDYSLYDIRTLTPDQISEVHGAYKYLAKEPIDNNLLKQLQSSSSGLYIGSAPNRFKKIKGIDNLIWDSVVGQVIQINSRLQQQNLQNLSENLFKGILTNKEKEQDYLNSKIPGITNAEWKELAAIGLDIASIVNPEAVTGSIMATGAAELRRQAKNETPGHKWDFWEIVGLGVDYLTGALGGILVAGDLVLGGKTAILINKITPLLRKLARAGAFKDLWDGVPGSYEAIQKVLNGEELTVLDWRAIGQTIRGLASHGRLNRGNRAERKVLQESGVSTLKVSAARERLNKLGFTRTKPASESTTPIVKAKINGEEKEIEITSEAKAKIEEKVSKAGNDVEARNKAVEDVLKSEGKIGASDKVEVSSPKSYRDFKFSPFKTTSQIFGTKSGEVSRGNDNFTNYINGKRGYWERYKYGSDSELKEIYNRLELGKATPTSEETPTPESAPKTKKEPITPEEIKSARENYKKILNINSNEGREYLPSKNDVGTNPDRLKQVINLKGEDLTFEINSDGKLIFNGRDTGIQAFGKNGSYALRRYIKSIVRERMKSADKSKTHPRDFKAMVEEIKKLKKAGFLKQGGTIDRKRIQQYKEFINK